MILEMRMDEISQEEFERALALTPDRKDVKIATEEEFSKMLKEMQNPSNAQKDLAVKIKIFLDDRIQKEITKNSFLSDNTRKWVETYNNILEKLQRSLHGDKSVSLHFQKVSHGEIAAKIREITVLDE